MLEGKLDDNTITKGSYRSDAAKYAERSQLAVQARDAKLQPEGGIEDVPTE